ncbi:MAG: hypothetical protein QM718_01470 [Steroidobacteraceae bacterium]
MLSARCATGALAMFASLSVAAAPLWSDMEALPGQLRVNGLALQVQSLRARAAPEQQLQRLRDSWGPLSQRCAIVRQGQWWLLDRVVGRWHETWQLRIAVAGGSEGYLSRADLSLAPRRPAAPPLSLPAQLLLQNSVEDLQSPHPFSQWTLRAVVSRGDVSALSQTLRRAALRAGWQWVEGAEDASLMRWRRANQLLQGQWVEQGSQHWLVLMLSHEG